MFKKIKLVFLSLLSLFSFQLSSCNETKRISFTLNYTTKAGSTFIRSKEEFDNYLSDETIFKPELSEEFNKINSKYNENYFKKKDLVSSIIWADGGEIYGFNRYKIEIKDGKWIICFKALYNKSVSPQISGSVFCYYTELTKKDGVNDIEVIVQKE